jgi:hypothetical protein
MAAKKRSTPTNHRMIVITAKGDVDGVLKGDRVDVDAKPAAGNIVLHGAGFLDVWSRRKRLGILHGVAVRVERDL